MREIKFRAWDKNRKEMCPDCINSMGNPNWRAGKIFMQFTGLHDKNGKEIYEGDVVYREVLSRDDPALSGRYGDKGVVEFFLGVYRIKLNEELEVLSIDINAGTLEVIGNIYEPGAL